MQHLEKYKVQYLSSSILYPFTCQDFGKSYDNQKSRVTPLLQLQLR
jgi:hypothetical protein